MTNDEIWLYKRGQNGGGGEVNYSTDEHAIGTWIDGSTVYEKSFSTTLPNGPDINNDSMLIGELPNNIDSIIEITGSVKDSTGNAWCATCGLPWYAGTNGWTYSFHLNPSNQLCIWFGNNNPTIYQSYAGGKAIATVRYTKSAS